MSQISTHIDSYEGKNAKSSHEYFEKLQQTEDQKQPTFLKLSANGGFSL